MRKVFAVLVLVSCGGPQTISEGCYKIGDTLCGRESNCGTLTVTKSKCLSDFVRDCCAGVPDCSKLMTDAAVQKISDCNGAIQGETCGQISAGLVPTACR